MEHMGNGLFVVSTTHIKTKTNLEWLKPLIEVVILLSLRRQNRSIGSMSSSGCCCFHSGLSSSDLEPGTTMASADSHHHILAYLADSPRQLEIAHRAAASTGRVSVKMMRCQQPRININYELAAQIASLNLKVAMNSPLLYTDSKNCDNGSRSIFP